MLQPACQAAPSNQIKTAKQVRAPLAPVLPFLPALLQRPIHLPIMPINYARTTQGDQADLFLLAWLKAHGGAGGNVQAHTVGGLAIESKGRINLQEMVVATDLDRAIPRMLDERSDGFAPNLGLDVTRSLIKQKFTWFHMFLLFLS